MNQSRRIWAAVANPHSGTAVEGFLKTLPRTQVTGYPFQGALIAALEREETPDLLVLHQLLPGPQPAVPFLRRVRAAAPGLRILYLAVDGPRLEELIQELIAAEVYDFLTGQFHPSELAQLVDHPRTRADIRHLEQPASDPGDRHRRQRPGAGTAPAAPTTRVLPSKVVAVWGPSRAGASTLVANLAGLLAQDPDLQVVAVDFNLIAPGLALLLDAFGDQNPYDHCMSLLLPELEGDRLTPERLDRYLLTPPGLPALRLFPGLFHPLALPRIREEHIQRILHLLRERFHLVLVDVPPALDFVSTFPTLDTAQQIFALFTPHYPARFHLKRYLLHLEEFSWERERVTLICNDARRVRRQELQEELGMPVAAVVPHLAEMQSWVERGDLPVLATPDPERQPDLAGFRAGLEEVAQAVFSRVELPDRRPPLYQRALRGWDQARDRLRRLLPSRSEERADRLTASRNPDRAGDGASRQTARRTEKG